MPTFKFSVKNLLAHSLAWSLPGVLLLSACQSAPPSTPAEATVDAAMTDVMAQVAAIGTGTAIAQTPQATPTDLSPTVITPTTIAATPTPDPLPSATARSTVSATATRPRATPPPAPEIFFFTASPAEIDPGGAVTLTWGGQGESATVFRHYATLWGVESASVPVTGTYVFTAPAEQRNLIVFSIQISASGHYTQASAGVTIRCPDTWFFTRPPAQDVCPASPPDHTPIQAQHFEHGLMLWRQSNDFIYVLVEGGSRYLVEINAWFEGMPIDDPTLTPPAGLLQPVRGFGLLWRTHEDYAGSLRSVLGWATGPEFSLNNAAFQCDSVARGATCYISGPGDVVYRLEALGAGWELWPPAYLEGQP